MQGPGPRQRQGRRAAREDPVQQGPQENAAPADTQNDPAQADVQNDPAQTDPLNIPVGGDMPQQNPLPDNTPPQPNIPQPTDAEKFAYILQNNNVAMEYTNEVAAAAMFILTGKVMQPHMRSLVANAGCRFQESNVRSTYVSNTQTMDARHWCVDQDVWENLFYDPRFTWAPDPHCISKMGIFKIANQLVYPVFGGFSATHHRHIASGTTTDMAAHRIYTELGGVAPPANRIVPENQLLAHMLNVDILRVAGHINVLPPYEGTHVYPYGVVRRDQLQKTLDDLAAIVRVPGNVILRVW